MRLVPVKATDVGRTVRSSPWADLLENFMKSNLEAAAIQDMPKDTTVARATSSLRSAIARAKVPVRTRAVNGIVYLVRTDKES